MNQIALFKTCRRCGETKPATEFYQDVRYRDGLQSYCIACYRAYQSQWTRDNAESQKKREHEWYLANKERINKRNNARCRERWQNDPEYRKRKNKQKCELLKRNAAYREKVEQRKKERYHSDPKVREQHTVSQKRYNDKLKSTPEGLRKFRDIRNISKHTRRVRIKATGSHAFLNTKEWEQLKKDFDYRCAACHERKPLDIDHIIPISKGGTNTIDNVQPLCHDCNQAKGTRTIDYRKGEAGG